MNKCKVVVIVSDSLPFILLCLFIPPPPPPLFFIFNGQDVISSSLPFSLSKTPDSFVLDLCVLVCVCAPSPFVWVCVSQNGVWTLTFLCFDNHRALCPSVPPAMTQGNVTCQSQNSYLQRLSSSNPTPPYPAQPVHRPLTLTLTSPPLDLAISPVPQLLSSSPPPEMTLDPSVHRLLYIQMANQLTPVWLFQSYCQFSVPWPKTANSTLAEWESQGQEVEFLSGPQYSWGLFSITLPEQAGWRFMRYMGM